MFQHPQLYCVHLLVEAVVQKLDVFLDDLVDVGINLEIFYILDPLWLNVNIRSVQFSCCNPLHITWCSPTFLGH